MRFATCAVALAVTAAAVAAQGISFASIGDWGCEGVGGFRAQDELQVSVEFAKRTQEVNAQFIINTGDNFYYCGVTNVSDPQFQETFENVFHQQSTMVPWYGCLGNHDYGYPGSMDAQIQYQSPNSNRWQIPARYYYKRLQLAQVNISLIVLDASPCQQYYRSSDPAGWDPCGSKIPGCPGCTFHQNVIAQSCTAQLQWLQQTLPTVPADDWKIALAHAPGTNLNVEDLVTPLQQANFHLYFNGHVHVMAHYQVDNMGTYITSGAGCMVRVASPTEKALELTNVTINANGKRDIRDIPPLEATSCGVPNPQHSCQIVWQKTVAGFTTHTFSSDYSSLTTNIYQVTTEGSSVVHTLTTSKSGNGPQPPAPSPPTPPGPAPPTGKCCYYSDSWCAKGDTCCGESGHSYGEAYCHSSYGNKHNCVWTGDKCIVG